MFRLHNCSMIYMSWPNPHVSPPAPPYGRPLSYSRSFLFYLLGLGSVCMIYMGICYNVTNYVFKQQQLLISTYHLNVNLLARYWFQHQCVCVWKYSWWNYSQIPIWIIGWGTQRGMFRPPPHVVWEENQDRRWRVRSRKAFSMFPQWCPLRSSFAHPFVLSSTIIDWSIARRVSLSERTAQKATETNKYATVLDRSCQGPPSLPTKTQDRMLMCPLSSSLCEWPAFNRVGS